MPVIPFKSPKENQHCLITLLNVKFLITWEISKHHHKKYQTYSWNAFILWVMHHQIWKSNSCFYSYTFMGSGFSKFVATILHIGMLSFLLRSFKDGWTSTSCINTLSPISNLLTSTSIFGGMCSAGHRYFKLVLILFKEPPVMALKYHQITFGNDKLYSDCPRIQWDKAGPKSYERYLSNPTFT